MRARLITRTAAPVRALQSCAKRSAAAVGPRTPGRPGQADSASDTTAGTASASLTSDSTRRWGGVRGTAATARSPWRTTAKYGGWPWRSGSPRRRAARPSDRLCSASRLRRNAPAKARNDAASGGRSTCTDRCWHASAARASGHRWRAAQCAAQAWWGPAALAARLAGRRPAEGAGRAGWRGTPPSHPTGAGPAGWSTVGRPGGAGATVFPLEAPGGPGRHIAASRLACWHAVAGFARPRSPSPR